MQECRHGREYRGSDKEDSTPLHWLNYHHQHPHNHRHHGHHPIVIIVVVAIIFNVIITFLQDIEDQIGETAHHWIRDTARRISKWPLPRPQQNQKFKTLLVGKEMMALPMVMVTMIFLFLAALAPLYLHMGLTD